MLFALMIGRKGKAQRTKGDAVRESGYIWEQTTRDTPPLLPERQVPSTPIIFRTKNTEKSRLVLIGKNFGKNLRENVSGEKESPQS